MGAYELLHQFIQNAARSDPEKHAVICDGGTLRYADLVDGAAAPAGAMAGAVASPKS